VIRIGLALSRDAIRAVAIRRGRLTWAAQTSRSEGSTLRNEIVSLLRSAPIPRWTRAEVVAAVGHSSSQTKALQGLPPLDDERALAGIVSSSIARFYLRNGAPLTASRVSIAHGQIWATAFDKSVVEAICESCDELRLALQHITSTAVVLSLATTENSLQWKDGESSIELTYRSDRTLASVRRVSIRPIESIAYPMNALLKALSPEAWCFADAFGAACASNNEAIAWYPESRREWATILLSGRRKWKFILGCVALLAVIVTPSISDAIMARRAKSEFSRISPAAARALRTQAELTKMTRALEEVAAFARSRQSQVLLLSDITRSIPTDAALTMLQVDSTTGTIVIVAPRVAHALAGLDTSAAVIDAEIVGPVTKEIIGSKEFDKASVHFRLRKQMLAGK
jgi:hypothetical protein